jgi:hypothetical protein
MPVIKKETVFFGNKEKYERIIKCNSKGTFSCNLPEEFLIITNNRSGEIRASSLEGLEKEFKEVKTRYEEREETEEYVICYNVNMTVVAATDVNEKNIFVSMNKEGSHHWIDTNESAFNHTPISIKVTAGTYKKKIIKFKNYEKVIYNYDYVSSKDEKQLIGYFQGSNFGSKYDKDSEYENELPYSDELRDMFNYVGENLVKVALLLSKISKADKIKKLGNGNLKNLIGFNSD